MRVSWDMAYRVLADVAMVVHLAFLLFVALGGYLALWWHPEVLWWHLPAVAWGFSTALMGWGCPLTALENWARVQAGREQLVAGGFIEHYLTDVVYPGQYLRLLQALVLLLVVTSWACLWWRAAHSGQRSVALG